MRIPLLLAALLAAACSAPPDDASLRETADSTDSATAATDTAVFGDARIDAVNRTLEQARRDAEARERDVAEALERP